MKDLVLIVEDEKAIADSMAFALKKEGFDTVVVSDGEAAITQFTKQNPALVILDLMLPKVSGEEVCRRIRKESDVPIIVVSAKDSEIDKVVVLELGADDYMVKPFSLRELVARVRGLLRRASKPIPQEEASIRVGPLYIDEAHYLVMADETKLDLTPKEFAFLKLLMQNVNIVVTIDTIIDRVWGYDFYGSTKIVAVYVRKLRDKLGDRATLIHNIRGVGYKLEVDTD